MEKFGIGQPVRRHEDRRFLTGSGAYSDDPAKPGQVYIAFTRSPVAHAKIRAVDTAAALAAPGVLRVYTGADLQARHIRPIGIRTELTNVDGTPLHVVPRFPLEHEKVRHAGDCVAAVVATGRAEALNASELVAVTYAELPVVVEPEAALAPDAPALHERPAGQSGPPNLVFDWQAGDEAKADAGLAGAAHLVSCDLTNNRVVPSALEPRSLQVWPNDPEPGPKQDRDSQDTRDTQDTQGNTPKFILRGSIQNVFVFQDLITACLSRTLGLKTEDLRCYCDDQGGGFGAKNQVQPEHILCVLAAADLGRPVRWTSTRSEAFVSDIHARAVRSRVQLGLSAGLKITALKIATTADIGAYCSTNGPLIPTIATSVVLGSAYDVPGAYMRVRGAYTNTVPTDAYRGAGRPESNYMIERIIHIAARQLGVSGDDIRRANLLRPDRLPYTTAAGKTIDAGNFPKLLELGIAGYAGYAERVQETAAKARRTGRNLLRGLGTSFYMEVTLGAPAEFAGLKLLEDGTIELRVGSQNAGMGHETALRQLISAQTGVGFDAVSYRDGDTAATPTGGGHGGSRTMVTAGAATALATEKLVTALKRVAGEHLGVPADRIGMEGGLLRAKGSNRTLDLSDIARLSGPIDVSHVYQRDNHTFPAGYHSCEVEVDADTGVIRIDRYRAVDDFGTIINPLIATGQVMGGVAQGLGQAMLERVVYDENGQPLTGSFMDYAMPRADTMPPIEVAFYEGAPTPVNALGVKGCGEAGCIASSPALVNAVENALAPLGVTQPDMPLTPHRVWRAIQDAAQNAQHPGSKPVKRHV